MNSGGFVGLTVLVTLHNGQSVEGTIEAVGRDSNLLLLADAVVHGDTTMRLPRLELTGEQIASIEVLSGVPAAAPVPPPAEPPTWQQSAPSSPILGGRRPRQVTPQKTPRKTDWSKDDVQRYKSTEFDFQANLGLFDKKKIFKEIQEMDETRPEERLVAHNLSQRKMRHDQNVLERRLMGEEGDQIVLETATTATTTTTTTATTTASPPLGETSLPAARQTQPRGGVPCVDASLLASIEQQILLSGALSNDQVVENAARSLAAFLFDQDAQIFSQTILLLLSPDRMGVYALAVGRHLLNRGYRLAALPPVDTRLAPGYFSAALRQFGKFGGELVTAVRNERRYSLVISCIGNTPALGAPVCALVPDVGAGASAGAGATWNVRFGLPSELPPNGGPTVVCDVGWPPALVDAILGEPWKYSSTFGNTFYIVIRTK